MECSWENKRQVKIERARKACDILSDLKYLVCREASRSLTAYYYYTNYIFSTNDFYMRVKNHYLWRSELYFLQPHHFKKCKCKDYFTIKINKMSTLYLLHICFHKFYHGNDSDNENKKNNVFLIKLLLNNNAKVSKINITVYRRHFINISHRAK